MKSSKLPISLVLSLLFSISLIAQQNDSTINSLALPGVNNISSANNINADPAYRLTSKTLLVPIALIAYGSVFQASKELKEFDVNIKNIVRKDADFHSPVDNYLQYAPGLSVFALNALGIKGKNNFRDMSMIYLLSNVIMAIPVQAIKKVTKVARPEGFGTNAFPSGHTATAFVGAEFLNQEYKDVSPWYGIAGYFAATATGILRMYNNKHWLRDVVAGAGFGIASTKVSYWLYPKIKKWLFKDKQLHSAFMPFYQNKSLGVAFVHNF